MIGLRWQRAGPHVISTEDVLRWHALARGGLLQPMRGCRALRIVALQAPLAAGTSQGTAPRLPHRANGRAGRYGRGGRGGRRRMPQTMDLVQTGSAGAGMAALEAYGPPPERPVRGHPGPAAGLGVRQVSWTWAAARRRPTPAAHKSSSSAGPARRTVSLHHLRSGR